MKLQNWPRPFAELIFSMLGNAFCVENTTFRSSAISPKFHHMMRLHEKGQSNITECCACHEEWHSKIIKCCPCHENDTPASPNIASAMKNDCHESWLIFVTYMKRHLHCGEQPSKLRKKFATRLKCHSCRMADDSTMIRTWTGRLPPVRSSRLLEIHFCTQKYNISRSGHLPAFHQTFKYCACHKSNTPTSPNCTCHEKQHCNIITCCPLPLLPNVAFQNHQMLGLPRKVTLQQHQIAPATKSNIATSPNIALATKSDIPTSPKCCACHEKWHSNISKSCVCHEWDASDVSDGWWEMWLTCDVRDVNDVWATLLWATLLWLSYLR